MPRSRTIKPDFFRNELLAVMPATHRLLYAGLWTEADRRGRLEDRPARLKMAVLPCDDVDVDAALNDLAAAGFLVRYSIAAVDLIQILAFEKHQHFHHREKESEYSPPSEAGAVVRHAKSAAKNTIDNAVFHAVESVSRMALHDYCQIPCAVQKTDNQNQAVEMSAYLPYTADSVVFCGVIVEKSVYEPLALVQPGASPSLYPLPSTLLPAPVVAGAPDVAGTLFAQNEIPGLGLAAVVERSDGIPVADIARAYNTRCNQLPAVNPDKIRRSTGQAVRGRWREDPDRRSLAWWEAYFDRVAASSFLCGRTGWRATFDWLVRPSNMHKTLEGAYDGSPGERDQLQVARARRQWSIIAGALSNPAGAAIEDPISAAVIAGMGGLRRLSRMPRYDLQVETGRFIDDYLALAAGQSLGGVR